ncbi:thioredoxin family protein [Oxalobacteraceae bacterium A2-2]
MAAIAWLGGSLDAAYTQARSLGRPLFLYWGALWCPPCNRLKAEIFANSEFGARTAQVLAYHLDGDAAGAQALAAQLGLRSYPTLVLFTPDGAEITRLPCELDAEQFTAAFDNALAVWRAGSGAAAALQAALSGSRALAAAEWQLLAWYAWDTDEQRLLAGRDPAATLLALAGAAPAGLAARYTLLAQVLAGRNTVPGVADALLAVCADPATARANMDLLTNHGAALLRHAGEGVTPAAVAVAQAARPWVEDFWLGPVDRLMALRLQLRMARYGAPAADLAAQVQSAVREMLAACTDPYERHSLVNTVVSALNDAGLAAQAEQVLLDELPRSHSPYYFMLSLASAAKRRGDTAAVLDWYQRAAAAAVGSATRLQWGATWLAAVADLAPHDEARLAQAAEAVLADIQRTPDARQQRNLTQLRKLAAALEGRTGPAAVALRAAIA